MGGNIRAIARRAQDRSDLNNAVDDECYDNQFAIRARFCIRKVSNVVVQCVR